MQFLRIFPVYLVLLTACLTTDVQTSELTSSNVTTTTANKVLEESEGNIKKNGQQVLTKNKKGKEQMPLNLSSGVKPKAQVLTPNSRSTQMPLNLVIDGKTRTVPIKIPLVLKTTNNKSNRRKSTTPKIEINLGKNKIPNTKVKSKEKVTTKSALPKKKLKPTTHKHKSKNNKFFEDASSNDIALPTLTKSKTNICKQPEKKDEFDVSKVNLPVISNESKHNVSLQTNLDDKDTEHLNNGVDSMAITKLKQQPNVPGIEVKAANDTSTDQKSNEDHLIKTANESEVAKTEEVNIALFVNKNGFSPVNELPPKDENNYENDVITIINHNYEEVEERSSAAELPASTVDTSPQCQTPSWDVTPTNTYDNYYKYDQTVNSQYPNYNAESNPDISYDGNNTPCTDIPETFPANAIDDVQPYSSCSATQDVQDVYYGPQPEISSCIVDISPGNARGRIWRTWKDTHIHISKPSVLYNRCFDYARNINQMYYGAVPKTSTPYCTGAIGLNAYYNNLNNPSTYPYSYSNYPYML